MRDLPGCVVSDLALYLNPKAANNWINLAGRLGFTQNMIDNIQLQPEDGLQKVIVEWGIKNGSTVGKLYEVLSQMKREDAMGVLETYCQSKAV